MIAEWEVGQAVHAGLMSNERETGQREGAAVKGNDGSYRRAGMGPGEG